MPNLTWPRVLTGALMGLVLSFISIMAINRVVIPPLLVFAIVFTALAVLLPRAGARRWPYYLTALVAVAVLAGNAPFIADDGMHPETFLTFVPTIIATKAAVLAIIASLAIATNRAPTLARPVGLIAAALVLAVFVGSAALTALAGDDQPGDGDVMVVAQNISYPATLEAKAGTVAFFIRNRDVVRHTFAIQDLGLTRELPAARDRRVLTQLKPGTYKFFCTVPGHERMAGMLEVK